MIPVLTPEQMAAVDRDAPEPVEVLVERAGSALRRAAVKMLGGTYGRRVVVLAGPGNNGADGRVAATQLERRGVRVRVIDVADAPTVLPLSDLVIDAAFGTGLRDEFAAPSPNGAPVLAVDIASGVSGADGTVHGSPLHAACTITFAALKPGLLMGEGPAYCGEIVVADIGLDVDRATIHLVEDADVVAWVPARKRDAHKWDHAVRVLAGSRGMGGAAALCSSAAMRAGAGYVRLSSLDGSDVSADAHVPVEVVVTEVGGVTDGGDGGAGDDAAVATVLDDIQRFAAMAIGPGLGRSRSTRRIVRDLVVRADAPLVLDGDGLWALGRDAGDLLQRRDAPTVLTPHDGEFERLTGATPRSDRITEVRDLAAATGAVVLLKGATTVVADPDGQVLLSRTGDQQLATAGTGDVLTGMIAAHLALGAAPLFAAAAAAHLHGRLAERSPDGSPRDGSSAEDPSCGGRGPDGALVASDLLGRRR